MLALGLFLKVRVSMCGCTLWVRFSFEWALATEGEAYPGRGHDACIGFIFEKSVFLWLCFCRQAPCPPPRGGRRLLAPPRMPGGSGSYLG